MNETQETDIFKVYSSFSDEEYFKLLIESISIPSHILPGFPPPNLQEIFVGKSNEDALNEAYTFYRFIKTQLGNISTDSTILDFGVGWGRIIRFFAKDVEENNLFGVDVDPEILKMALSLRVPGNLLCIEPLGKLPVQDKFFDIIYAFSVFSHLSENSAIHWLHEIIRVLKPGGTFIFTTTTDWFLNLYLSCKNKKGEKNSYEEIYSAMFQDPKSAIRAYKRGEHVYAPTGGNSKVLSKENYGWAAIPPKFIKREIGKDATMIKFIDKKTICEQGIFVVKKGSN